MSITRSILDKFGHSNGSWTDYSLEAMEKGFNPDDLPNDPSQEEAQEIIKEWNEVI